MKNNRTFAFALVLMATLNTVYAWSQTPSNVLIKSDNQSRIVQTPRYQATVAADGCLTNLQINGQEFLRPNFMVSRGSYLFQGSALKLPDIQNDGEKAIVAKSDKAKIRYEFTPDRLTCTLTNSTDQPMLFLIVFDAAITGAMGDDGQVVATPIQKKWPVSTWIAGTSRLKISGGTSQWGWRENSQVWQTDLAPGQTREVVLEPSIDANAPVVAPKPVTVAAPAITPPVTATLPPVNRPVTDANLVKNGDFEQESPTLPAGWAMWGSSGKDPKNYTRDNSNPHSGAASFRIFHPKDTSGYIISDLKNGAFRPQKGMGYDISFWAKTDVPGPSTFGMFSITSVDPLIAGPPLAGKTLVLDTNWKQFNFKIAEGTDFSIESANYLTLNFNATASGVNSIEKTLWIDDIVVTEKRVGPPLASGISLSPLFAEGTVLQRQMPIPIWGNGKIGQKISVSLNGKSASTIADANGKWTLRLPAMEAGGPFELKFQNGTPDAFGIKNVYVGDVWLASGQSNMEYPLQGWAANEMPAAKKALEAVLSANDPQLHFFTVTKATTDTPQTELKGAWRETTPENAGAFSAVAYYFARELRRELNIPIGVIHSSWGGSSAQGWTRREVLESNPELKSTLDWWQRTLEGYPKVKADYDIQLAAWQVEADKAKLVGTTVPKQPSAPIGPGYYTRPAALYNGMIAPLLPYGIKGSIWYQGESNAASATQYQKLFPSMIANWRKDWNQGDFPFLFVQLANFRDVQTAPSETGSWAEIREAQAQTLAVPATGMAVAIDLADVDNPNDIHPKNKWDVGKRLSLVALSQVYGRKIISSGPIYDSMTIEGNAIRLKFKNAVGLKAKGDTVKGFAIAGADKKFVWADAKIDGETIVVSSPQIQNPVAVRYDWASNPIGNLYNGADLPASTFRTDK